MKIKLARFLRERSGGAAIEYGLLAAFIAACLINALPELTSGVQEMFQWIGGVMGSGGSQSVVTPGW